LPGGSEVLKMRGGVRVGHLSESAEKTVQVRLFGLTVMFLMTAVRLDGLTSATLRASGAISHSHRQRIPAKRPHCSHHDRSQPDAPPIPLRSRFVQEAFLIGSR